MPGWNYAKIWEVIADQIPDAPAQILGDRTLTWREFDQRANGVAHHLLEAGAVEQDVAALDLDARGHSTSTTAPSTWSPCTARGRPAWCR